MFLLCLKIMQKTLPRLGFFFQVDIFLIVRFYIIKPFITLPNNIFRLLLIVAVDNQIGKNQFLVFAVLGIEVLVVVIIF